MRSSHVLRAMLAAGLGVLGLLLFWSILPATGASDAKVQRSGSSQGAETTAPAPKPAPPDPMWLKLVHATQPVPANSPQSITTMNVNLTEGYVAGRATSLSPVTMRVLRGSEQVADATATPVPDPDGFFYLAYLHWVMPGDFTSLGPLQPGDVVWVAQGSSTLSMTVPLLTGFAAPGPDTVYGQAPASTQITLYLAPFADPDSTYSQMVTVDNAGNYTSQWSSLRDLRPRDRGLVVYAQDASRRAYAAFVAPFLRAQAGGNSILGYAPPNTTVTLQATGAGGALLSQFSLPTNQDGAFVQNDCTSKLKLAPGDQVLALAAGQAFSMTVGEIHARSDLSLGRVLGQTAPAAQVEILRWSGPVPSTCDNPWVLTPASQAMTSANASGAYTVSMPLAFADYGAAVITSTQGNQTFARYAVPFVRISLGTLQPFTINYGQVDDQSTPITVEVRGPSGYAKDNFQVWAYGNGSFTILPPQPGGYEDDLVLESGDVVDVSTPGGLQIHLPLPVLTAFADQATSTVSGHAPPGARLEVILTDYPENFPPPPPYVPPGEEVDILAKRPTGSSIQYPVTLVVTATAQGNYTADFSSLGQMTSSASGYTELVSPEGNRAARFFRVIKACPATINAIQVGGNQVGLYHYQPCPDMVLRLRDTQGSVKFQNIIQYNENTISLTNSHGDPIPILAGDRFEIFSGQDSTYTEVPVLTAGLDPQAKRINGQAPPGSTIWAYLYSRLAENRWYTTTTATDGAWTIPLPPQVSLQAGDRVRARIASLKTSEIYAIGVLPQVQASLYIQGGVDGWLPPLTPYTFTAQTQGYIDGPYSGYADTYGRFGADLHYRPLPGDLLKVQTPAQTLQMTVPNLTARIERASATISGQAPPGARLHVNLQADGTAATQEVIATAGGQYSAAFPSLAPLKVANGSLVIYDGSGYSTTLNFATTSMNVHLGIQCIDGNTDPGARFSMTLVSADGASIQTLTDLTSSNQGTYVACFSLAIQPGDKLTFVSPSETDALTVPNLTASHDAIHQVLKGLAPPGGFIKAFLPVAYPWGGYRLTERHTFANASGIYGVDTSDLFLALKTDGYVFYVDSIGNTVQQGFTITGYQIYCVPFIR